MTSITIRRPSTPAFNPGTPTTPAGSLKRSRINFKPSTAVLLARPSRSLVSAGRNLDRTLALKDCAFDIAEICGKSGRRSERIVVRTTPEKDLLKASPQDNRTIMVYPNGSGIREVRQSGDPPDSLDLDSSEFQALVSCLGQGSFFSKKGPDSLDDDTH